MLELTQTLVRSRGRQTSAIYSMALLLVSWGLFGDCHAAEAPATSGEVVQIISKQSSLEMPERFSKEIEFKPRIVTVTGFDPNIISPTAVSQHRLRIQGVTQGVTTMVVTDENDIRWTIEILVTGDARLLQAVLQREFPNTAVTATQLRDNVLLRGWVTEPQQIPQIVEIAELYSAKVLNQMRVGGPQQVQLKCQVMEVQRSKTRQLGFNFINASRSAVITGTPGAIAPISGTLSQIIGGAPATTFAGSANPTVGIGVVSNNHAFTGLLLALREEGLLKILSEPQILTRSGEPALIQSGGEFPVPVPQALGTITIEYRDFGVKLESVPMVLSPHRLKQTIIAEVSERDLTTAIVVQGFTVPGITKRTVETQVEMNFGETLAIGGLISIRRTAETRKIPGLGELPLIGAAFRRVRYDDAETELLVMITPEFVGSLSEDQVPERGPGEHTAEPTDRELFGDGAIEVPNFGNPTRNSYSNSVQPPPGISDRRTMPALAPAGSLPPGAYPPPVYGPETSAPGGPLSTTPGAILPGQPGLEMPLPEPGLIPPPASPPQSPAPGLDGASRSRKGGTSIATTPKIKGSKPANPKSDEAASSPFDSGIQQTSGIKYPIRKK
jgi:pilus assembly protein CpaC